MSSPCTICTSMTYGPPFLNGFRVKEMTSSQRTTVVGESMTNADIDLSGDLFCFGLSLRCGTLYLGSASSTDDVNLFVERRNGDEVVRVALARVADEQVHGGQA